MHDGINRKKHRTTNHLIHYSKKKKRKKKEVISSVFDLCFRTNMMDTSRVVIHTQGEIFSVLADRPSLKSRPQPEYKMYKIQASNGSQVTQTYGSLMPNCALTSRNVICYQ